MDYDLVNEHGKHLHVKSIDWYRVLDLAEDNGWEPLGTVRLDQEGNKLKSDSTDYESMSGQHVLGEDVANLVTALEQVLPTISDIEYQWDHSSMDAYYALKPEQYWSGAEQKQHLRDFITFCRQGGFRIARWE